MHPGERKKTTTSTSTKKMVFSHALMQTQHCGNLLPPCDRSAHPHAFLQPLCLDGSFIFTLRWSNSCSSLLLNRRRRLRRRRRPICSWESGRRPSELYFFLPPKQSSNRGTFSSLAFWSVYLACLLSLCDSRTSCLTPVAPADWCSGVAPCGYDDPYLARSPWACLHTFAPPGGRSGWLARTTVSGWARPGVRHVTFDLRASRQTPPAESYDRGWRKGNSRRDPTCINICGARGGFLRTPLLTLVFIHVDDPRWNPLCCISRSLKTRSFKVRILPGDQSRSAHLGDNRAELSPAPLSLRQHVLCFPLLKTVLQGEEKIKNSICKPEQAVANMWHHEIPGLIKYASWCRLKEGKEPDFWSTCIYAGGPNNEPVKRPFDGCLIWGKNLIYFPLKIGSCIFQ